MAGYQPDEYILVRGEDGGGYSWDGYPNEPFILEGFNNLRTAAIAINENFGQAYDKEFAGPREYPGRKFTVGTTGDQSSPPEIGKFNVGMIEPTPFSAEASGNIRISIKDADGQSIYGSKGDSLNPGGVYWNDGGEFAYGAWLNLETPVNLELYQRDFSVDEGRGGASGINNWILRGLYSGTIEFDTVYVGEQGIGGVEKGTYSYPGNENINDHWKFEWIKTIFSTPGNFEEGQEFYINIKGLW